MSTLFPFQEKAISPKVVLLLVLVTAAFSTSALSQTDTWKGGNGDWSDAGMWSTGAVPGTSSNVQIDNGNPLVSMVTLDENGSINNLTIDSDDSLGFNDNTSLTINGTSIANAGTIQLNSGNDNTNLIIAGNDTVTLSGGGKVIMGNNGANRIYSAGGSGVLINQETIEGSGQLGVGSMSLTNSGTIDANQSTPLIVAPNGSGVTNTGTLEATSGGTLDLRGTYTNTGGTIQSVGTGSTVELDGASITGGTLTTSSSGVLESINSATLSGVTISTGSTYSDPDDTTTTLVGTITNNGTIALNSGNDNTNLQISGPVTLTGTGVVDMGNNGANRIYAPNGTDTLTNKETIQGGGQLGVGSMTLVNDGTIDANLATPLIVAPNAGTGVTNTAMMEATSGGTLDLRGSYTNTGGTIQSVGAGSTVELDGATIAGGTLTTSSSGVMESINSAILNGVTISKGTTYADPDNTSTELIGTITNNGTIELNSGNDNTNLQISGPVTLTGTGVVTMGNNGANRIYALNGTDTLTNKQTIQGGGQLGVGSMTLDNQGTIDANVGTALNVALSSGGGTNTGIMEATNGATLQLNGSTFTNTNGTIEALNCTAPSCVSVVQLLNGVTVNGGTLTTTGNGIIESANNATLNGVTISSGSTYVEPDDTSTTLMGTITNNGTVDLESGNDNTNWIVSGNTTVTLSGSGEVIMGNNGANRIYSAGNSGVLINQETIEGSGQLGVGAMSLTNSGTIDANQPTALIVDPNGSGVTNTAMMEATSGGTLHLEGSYTNTGGTIQSVGTGSTVELDGATITGGTLTTSSSGAMESISNATLNGVTISTGTVYSDPDNTTTTLVGTITNNGTMQLNSGNDNTNLQISGPVTLTGTGVVDMGNNGANRIYAPDGTDTLTNKETIQGGGQLGVGSMTLVNEGTIDANLATQLIVDPNSSTGVTNTATMEATSGGTLHLQGNYSNTGGTIKAVGTGSTVELDEATIKGGTLNSSGGGVIESINSATLNGVTISGGTTYADPDDTTTTLVGTITNNGTMQLNSGNDNTNLQISGPVTLTGTGVVTMGNNGANRIYAPNGTDTLTNDETIQGAGQLGVGSMGLINNGTIFADQGTALTVQPSSSGMTNNGTLKVASGSVMHVLGGPFKNFSGTTLTGGTYNTAGTLEIDQLGTSGGEIVTNAANIILSGASSVFVDANGNNALSALNANTSKGSFTINNGRNFTTAGNFTNNGTLTVGSSNSKFDVNGNLTNFSGTTLTGGTYNVTGTLQFNGANIVTNDANVTLSGSSSAIVNQSAGNGLANFATNDSGASFTINGGRNFTTAGNFTNNGTVTVGSGSKFDVNGNLTNFSGTTLTGGVYNLTGTLQFNGANIVTNAANITLSGSSSGIVNQSAVNALAGFATNASTGSFTINSGRNFTTGGNFTNNGTLTIGSGTKFDVNGNLTNFSGTTLTGGTYNISGTLQFNGANIVTNAANITLSGTSSAIVNQSAVNALAGFATNASGGTFSLASSRTFTTGGNFSNAGTLNFATGTSFTVGGTGLFTQTAGLTKDDGTLTDSGGLDLNGGSLIGKGTVSGAVDNASGTIDPGDSSSTAGILTDKGAYTQGASGKLDIAIGGSTAGTQFDELNATTANLNGTLNVSLINGFVPKIGQAFKIMNFNSETGSFSSCTCAINSTEHFSVTVQGTDVLLTVVSGVATAKVTPITKVTTATMLRDSHLSGIASYKFGQLRNPLFGGDRNNLMRPMAGNVIVSLSRSTPPSSTAPAYRLGTPATVWRGTASVAHLPSAISALPSHIVMTSSRDPLSSSLRTPPVAEHVVAFSPAIFNSGVVHDNLFQVPTGSELRSWMAASNRTELSDNLAQASSAAAFRMFPAGTAVGVNPGRFNFAAAHSSLAGIESSEHAIGNSPVSVHSASTMRFENSRLNASARSLHPSGRAKSFAAGFSFGLSDLRSMPRPEFAVQ